MKSRYLRQLLDRLDRPDPLDLDRDPAVLLVAAHEVDRADVGGPLPPHEPELLAERLRSRGERLLQVALDTVLLQRRRLAHVDGDVREHLGEQDLQPILALAAALAHHDAPASSSITVGGVIQLSGLYPPASACTSTEPSALISEQTRRLRQHGVEPAGVANLAAGDDQAHGQAPYRPLRTCPGSDPGHVSPGQVEPSDPRQVPPSRDAGATIGV